MTLPGWDKEEDVKVNEEKEKEVKVNEEEK